jgi:hypothetical protein
MAFLVPFAAFCSIKAFLVYLVANKPRLVAAPWDAVPTPT